MHEMFLKKITFFFLTDTRSHWLTFMQIGLHIQSFHREADIRADFTRVHKFVSEAFEMNAQDLKQRSRS